MDLKLELFSSPLEYESEHPYLIIDSGAYGHWQSGSKTSLDRYETYLDAVRHWIFYAVNMDRIPGSSGEWATPNEAEAACRVSHRNWKRLRKSGVPIAPVFHQGDALPWLHRYIEEGAEFIGISPTDSYPTEVRQRWLYDTHWWLEKSGVLNRGVLTHGLGVLAPRFLPEMRGMMFSADATTILRLSTMRQLILPLDADGAITFQGPLYSIHPVYVGTRVQRTPRKTDWQAIRDYLHALGLRDRYRTVGGRVVITDPHTLASANVHVAHLLMAASGVRCFVAGTDPYVLYTLAVEERYPYLLQSFGGISCRTLAALYHRSLRRPLRTGR